ncbi:MAG: peptide-methionine (R)-S-oxide reductase MsrB [Maricaulaceae bacterium]
MNRRTMILGATGLGTAGVLGWTAFSAAETDSETGALNLASLSTGAPDLPFSRGAFNPDGLSWPDLTDAQWRALTDAQWRALLAPAAFDVLRKEGTEYPGTSELLAEKRTGTYLCRGCGLELFRSETKYDSRTGWPSYFQPIEGALATQVDYKLVYPRTEYHCRRCLGHQGHVFPDGPPPTGQRYCNNGVALVFRPDAAVSANG